MIGLAAGGEAQAVIGGQRREVDRRLGIRGEHDERVAGVELGERRTGLDQRQRAGEPAGVEGALHTVGA
jgi:hypothetical protein